jgi:hypothetical protein
MAASRTSATARVALALSLQHGSEQDVHLEIVWDDNNEEHATKRATMTEITQAILDAPHYTKGRTDATDRAMLVGETHGRSTTRRPCARSRRRDRPADHRMG